jgi:glycerol-3-phosphate acyltransferase PlsX
MSDTVTIAVDAMGGDHGPSMTVPAVCGLLRADSGLQIVLTGLPAVVEPLLAAESALAGRLEFVACADTVAMDETPAEALRKKRDSSLRRAVDLVHDGRADACVSAGNTGALMATARFVLKTLPGIQRPAIVSPIPAIGGHTHMLDLGASTGATPLQLMQFAVMGSVLAADIHSIEKPRVGLLNIGTEENKGSEILQEAGRLLKSGTLNYVGFVEGHDIMSGGVDVVVSDGFTGNVALKTMEGAVRMLLATSREEIYRNWRTRLLGMFSRPLFRLMAKKLDPRVYNGATLVGLNGVVIKSHGAADAVAFRNAIRIAAIEARKGVPKQIVELLERQTVLEASA